MNDVDIAVVVSSAVSFFAARWYFNRRAARAFVNFTDAHMARMKELVQATFAVADRTRCAPEADLFQLVIEVLGEYGFAMVKSKGDNCGHDHEAK
jgi:hypothetical protein